MKTRGVSFRLICVYRPPNATNQLSLDLWRSLSRLCPDKSPVLIAGDFNLPNVDWKFLCRNKQQCNVNNHVLNEFFSFVRGNGLSQLINAPTCGKNVLDLVLCNEPKVVLETEITEPFVHNSVHRAIDFSLLVNQTCGVKREFYRDFNNANYVEIGNFLDSISWEEIFDGCRNVQDFWNLFAEV